MENCHTWIIISKWQNDLHTNTSRSVWPILYGLMIKMLQYKMYPAGELAVLRQLLFCKKSHQNSRSEKKNRMLNFSHFAPLSSYFAHAVHFGTIGLFCLAGFWIIVAPKFITHTTAGNHSLICITEKLYRKISLSVSGLSKRFFDRYLKSAKKKCPPTRKKKERKLSAPSSRDGNILKYLVRAQPSSTEAATLSSPDSDDDQTRPNWWITIPWRPYSAVCILLWARHNEKEMKVKPATSFKIIYSICW